MTGRASTRDDAALLRGDADSFAAFYRRHEDSVLAYFLRRTRSVDLAADLTAETFARALSGPRRFDPAVGEAGARALDDSVRRKLGIEPLFLDDDAIARIGELSGAPALAALDSLPEDQRAAVVGRVVHEQSYRSSPAGRSAPRARCRTVDMRSEDGGAYLFVLPAGWGDRLRLTITDRQGRTCEPLAGEDCARP